MLGNKKTVEFLLQPQSLGGQRVEVDIQNYQKTTPLMIACTNSHIEIIQILLLHKAQVNIENDVGMTPLHSACLAGSVKAVDLLLD
jgi:ankyrin repeat protein